MSLRLSVWMFLITGFLFSGNTQDLYDFKHSLEFANYLWETGQYEHAAQEYERVVHLKPQNDTVKLYLLRSYRKAGAVDNGLRRIKHFYPEITDMPRTFSLEYARLLSHKKDYPQLHQFARQSTTLPEGDQRAFQIYSYLMQKQWESAHQFYQDDTMSYAPYRALGSVARDALDRKRRSPFLATTMSAVIPGSGKMYAGQWRDGIFSLFLVGVSAWQSYRGFKRHELESVHGWVFGSIGLGFYIGNLYGSAKAAVQFNERIDQKYVRQAQNTWSHYY